MRYSKLWAVIMLLIVIVSVCSCNENTEYVKNPTASLKSDSDDYFVPNIYVDVEEGENKDPGGDKYGPYIPIE